MARRLAAHLPLTETPIPRALVAIPAQNEEEHIGRCLAALRAQVGVGRHEPEGRFGVLLLLNNCCDGTRAVAVNAWQGSSIPLHLAEVDLAGPAANAGFARGLALDLAALWLERTSNADGVLLTSDADSRVAD
ncbi:MAG: hypothetical protein B7Z15_13200, partial [Rhizobiales bacterium 32-66-8]